MGFFTGVGKVTMQQQRGNFFKPGEYIVLTVKTTVKELRKSGQPSAIVDARIEEILVGEPNVANRKGETVVQFFDLSRKPSGALTEKGELGMGRLKAYVAEVLGGAAEGVMEDMVTEEACEDLFSEEGEGAGVGMKFHVRVTMNAKGTFTNVYWSALPTSGDVAAE